MKIKVKAGDKFYYYDEDIWHVLSVINDNGSTLIVIKSWAKHKFRWVYKVVDLDSLSYWLKETEQLVDKGDVKIIKAKKIKTNA